MILRLVTLCIGGAVSCLWLTGCCANAPQTANRGVPVPNAVFYIQGCALTDDIAVVARISHTFCYRREYVREGWYNEDWLAICDVLTVRKGIWKDKLLVFSYISHPRTPGMFVDSNGGRFLIPNAVCEFRLSSFTSPPSITFHERCSIFRPHEAVRPATNQWTDLMSAAQASQYTFAPSLSVMPYEETDRFYVFHIMYDSYEDTSVFVSVDKQSHAIKYINPWPESVPNRLPWPPFLETDVEPEQAIDAE